MIKKILFSSFIISVCISVISWIHRPVQALGLLWIDVKAIRQNNHTCIKWVTTQESQASSKDYQVQKSEDGQKWENAGSPVPALKGTGNNSYSWMDSTVEMPETLYRIKHSNTYNKTSFSNIVEMRLHGNGAALLYPNPANTRLYVTTNNTHAQMKSFDLYDRFGRHITYVNLPASKAVTQYSISTASLPPGFYTLVIGMVDGSKSVHSFSRQ